MKPAALITRMSPHDRALPKPAFELTEKKLESAISEEAGGKSEGQESEGQS